MRRFACALGALGALGFATLASAPALADCVPGTGLCASAGVGVGVPVIGIPGVQANGQITIGIPPVVVPAPATTPAAPPVIVYEPARPPVINAMPMPRPRPRMVYAPQYGTLPIGLDLRFDAAAGFGGSKLGNAYGMGGGGIGLRLRPFRHLGFEGGIDLMGGRDYNDNHRVELAGNVGALLYVNPRSRAQFYFSGGGLVDYAHATNDLTGFDQKYTHLGGYGGVGLEVFLNRHVALHFDARGLVRQNVRDGADRVPEFVEPGTGRSTNTSGGFVGSAGALFYF
jgi:hypothetical protein